MTPFLAQIVAKSMMNHYLKVHSKENIIKCLLYWLIRNDGMTQKSQIYPFIGK